jgi:hypothetical protein
LFVNEIMIIKCRLLIDIINFSLLRLIVWYRKSAGFYTNKKYAIELSHVSTATA